MLIIELVLSCCPVQPLTPVAEEGGSGQGEVSPDVTGVALAEKHSCREVAAHKTSCRLGLLSAGDKLCPSSPCWKAFYEIGS